MKKTLFLFLACLLVASAAQGTDMPEETIGANTDDAHESNDWTVITNNVLVYMEDADEEWGGFRFTTIPIAQGATITSAALSLCISSPAWDDAAHTIFCEDIDDAPTFTTDMHNIGGRTATDSLVEWNASALGTGWKDTPDLSDIVQEIVNRPGWESGNDIAFLFRCETGSKLSVYAYDNGSNYAKFNCSYTTEEPPAAGQVIIIGDKSDSHRAPMAEVNWREQ